MKEQVGLIGVVQVRHETKVILVCDRVVLVGVALSAAGCQSQPCRAGRRHPVRHGVVAVLQRINPAFFIQHRVAVKAGRDQLVPCGLGQHVTGKLLDGKLIKRHAVVDGPYHPIPVWPDASITILLVTIGVSVACQVEPASGPSLSVPW